MKFDTQTKENKQKGFTLLFAVLVSVLVLAVGASMISIAFKQISFSTIGRESQFAFYNADSGVECALYYDFMNGGTLGSSIFPKNNTQAIGTLKVNCLGQDISLTFDGTPTSEAATTTIAIPTEGNDRCFITKVGKSVSDGSDGYPPGYVKTTIDSRGYNTCDDTNPRRYERGLKVTY